MCDKFHVLTSFFTFYARYFYKYFVELLHLWYNLISMTISPHLFPQQINGSALY